MPKDILQVGPLQWGRINRGNRFGAGLTLSPISKPKIEEIRESLERHRFRLAFILGLSPAPSAARGYAADKLSLARARVPIPGKIRTQIVHVWAFKPRPANPYKSGLLTLRGGEYFRQIILFLLEFSQFYNSAPGPAPEKLFPWPAKLPIVPGHETLATKAFRPRSPYGAHDDG